jgi:hypothetical protein
LESNERDILEDYEIDEELEPTKGQIEEEDSEDSNDTPGLLLCHQGWTELGIKEYFEDLKEWGKEWTLYFFKVLATVETKIYYDDLIKKISELSGKPFTGRKFAGVTAGISRRTVKKGRERLHIENKDDRGWYLMLNPKYKSIIKKYFGLND